MNSALYTWKILANNHLKQDLKKEALLQHEIFESVWFDCLVSTISNSQWLKTNPAKVKALNDRQIQVFGSLPKKNCVRN